ncbi:hypothetical protein CRM22_009096 [Opisthorchis felineus]|uniref:Inositol hexakisphosphate and diphosphoinositol-pentakisphosphate kinase n=1 Tax=Opisthorchis felineus TaxID=147828 RepID=A0A4S2L905_OPIFE|nr:hypothetical protein CRM22_009096 [Opisthorchis felineus]
MGEGTENGDTVIRIGLCAMAKKAMSKPMKEILRRMDKFSHIRQIIFDEHVILHEPIESWPLCDALVSFYSEGFPLEKAIAYSKLRKPYLVNDLESQYILMDRRLVYECLKREGVPVPRYACVSRRPGSPPVNVVESDDSIEIDGQVFHKPFVEKPLNAEDHNVYIYFPSTAGGGSQRLFRKVGNLSSKYFPHSTIRTNGSYMYEEFMPTDGTDVKIYTVADDYAHAEARKSPALDGKVERDHEGKEVRYPVILTPREKIIAKKVAKAVQQQICGFDLLRANGMSYVCDVNGFSFVKSSKKYYDDCSHILGVLITRKLAPQLCVPAYLPPGTDVDTPLVPTTCGTIMELRCVIAVIRHGDRTPKQKMKMEVRHEKFFGLFFKYAGEYANELKLKRPTQLQEVLDIVRCILNELENPQDVDPQLLKNKPKFEQLKYVLEMYGSFSGINRKIQLKYHPRGFTKTGKVGLNDTTDACEPKSCLLLVVKWGGELTAAGRQQAERLGRAFRCIYPGGDGHYGKDPGLGLLRLHSTYRHDLKIYASDEGRVQMTAAAFAKGFLALEGELPPILVQMVKSANTNGLLDNDNDCRHYQHMVKRRIKDVMSKSTDFTEEDIEALVPTSAKSLVNAMRYVGNPRAACDRLLAYVKKLGARLLTLATCRESRTSINLYQGESWELLLRRWGKLWKDFRGTGEEYDLSKISDIYDNIKYDLQHNPAILVESEAQDFFMCAKSLADIVVPQEYGITKEEKLVIGQRICTPLMRKILSDARYTDVDECTRLHAGYSKGVASPERFVRTRLYFTSESHLHSLLTCLRYGELTDICTDEQWRRAMDYVASVSEINYLAQIVIMIYEDPTVEPKTEQRFHVELHFSPGAFALCHDQLEGSGFRPGKLERLNSQASMVSSATSLGKGSCDSAHAHSFRPKDRDSLSSCPVTPGTPAASNCTSGSQLDRTSGSITHHCSHATCPAKQSFFPSQCMTDAGPEQFGFDALKKRSGSKSPMPSELKTIHEYQTVVERLQDLKFWRDSVAVASAGCTTGSASDVFEDEEMGLCEEKQAEHTSVIGKPNAANTVDGTHPSSEVVYVSHLPGIKRKDASELLHTDHQPEAMQPVIVPTNNTATPIKSIGIGRFVITRPVTDHELKLNSTHTKSAVTLASNIEEPRAAHVAPLTASGGGLNVSVPRDHFPRSKLSNAHTSGRSAISCSPECCHYQTNMEMTPPDSVHSPEQSSNVSTSKQATNYSQLGRNSSPNQAISLDSAASLSKVRSGPLSKWLSEQAELVNGERSSTRSMLNGELLRRRHPPFRNRSQPRPVINFPLIADNDVGVNPTSYLRPVRQKTLPNDSSTAPIFLRDNSTVDDLSLVSVHPHLRIRHHSTGSICPQMRVLALSADSVPSQFARLASRHDYSVTPASAANITQTDSDLDRVPSLPDIQKPRISSVSGTTMCDAMMTYAGVLKDRMEDDALTNQALNAMTYPSHQASYNADLERLIRAVALGAPVARPFGRSLISTAVIRGSKDEGQASSSVPDIKRLMDDSAIAPPTLTPGSSKDFLVPTAPSVPEVYPLETLHNALTLSQLEAFFARLTTHTFPTPFTSPRHPSTPISYYDQHSLYEYHDSGGSLFSAFPHSATSQQLLSVDDARTNQQICRGSVGFELGRADQINVHADSNFHFVGLQKSSISTSVDSDVAEDIAWQLEDLKTQ